MICEPPSTTVTLLTVKPLALMIDRPPYSKRAEPAGGRVEEHVAFGEAVLALVAVDREPVERGAGGAADERDFDDVRLAVVAGGFFEVHRAQQHLRRDVGGHQPARLELFDLAAAGRCDCGLLGWKRRATSGDVSETHFAKRVEKSHELPPCTVAEFAKIQFLHMTSEFLRIQLRYC